MTASRERATPSRQAIRIAAIFLILCAPCAATAGASDFDAVTGFRIERYRAPLPDEAPGAKRIFVEELERLVADQQAVLVDVAPAMGGVFDDASGTWKGLKPHQHIPGSTWLPDVGKGDPPARMIAYFSRNLERLTGGDKTRPIIIYCYADCWMSWNAIKRAGGLGYTSLYWFPEGTDGWRDWDKPFAPAEPVAVGPAQ